MKPGNLLLFSKVPSPTSKSKDEDSLHTNVPSFRRGIFLRILAQRKEGKLWQKDSLLRNR